MNTIPIESFQKDPLGYIKRVEAGETITIIRANKPVAELKPAIDTTRPRRPYGLCAGEFKVPDDFDEPLPEEVLAQFEGS